MATGVTDLYNKDKNYNNLQYPEILISELILTFSNL